MLLVVQPLRVAENRTRGRGRNGRASFGICVTFVVMGIVKLGTEVECDVWIRKGSLGRMLN